MYPTNWEKITEPYTPYNEEETCCTICGEVLDRDNMSESSEPMCLSCTEDEL